MINLRRMLRTWISEYREEILARCRETLSRQAVETDIELLIAPMAGIIEVIRMGIEDSNGEVGLLLDDMAIERGAAEHGEHRASLSFNVAQVAIDYSVVGSSISGVIQDCKLEISEQDYHLMNLAIDGGVAASLKHFDASSKVEQRRASAEMMGAFVHELRNALNGGTLSWDIIKTSGQIELDSRAAQALTRGLARMEHITAQLATKISLDVASEPSMEAYLIDEIVEESIDTIIGARRARVMVEKHDDAELPGNLVPAPARMWGDRQLAVSALSNVIQNALKYSGDENIIVRILTDGLDGAVTVEVQDFGPGICAVAQAKLFVPFARGNHKNAGLGLGLTIIRHAMEAQGGTLALQSVAGQGSLFRLKFLPVAERER